jgi:glutathione S-transferase
MREIVGQISGERPQSREKYEYALKELQRELEVVNSHLRLRTFMVGDAVTVVDISLAVHLEKVFRYQWGYVGQYWVRMAGRNFPIC